MVPEVVLVAEVASGRRAPHQLAPLTDGGASIWCRATRGDHTGLTVLMVRQDARDAIRYTTMITRSARGVTSWSIVATRRHDNAPWRITSIVELEPTGAYRHPARTDETAALRAAESPLHPPHHGPLMGVRGPLGHDPSDLLGVDR